MYYEFDIDWKSMPLSFAMIGEADIRSDQWWAKCRSTMLSQIRQHFSDDDIDEKEMLRWFEEFQHKYCERRGHRLVPTPTGTMLVKLAYEDLAPYRGLLETMSELENEVKKLPELYRIYEVISNVMDIYDNYCLDLDEILVPSASQAPPTLPPAASSTAVLTGEVSDDAAESVVTAVQEKPKGRKKVEPHVDRDELATYFNALFKGLRGNPDYFSDLVKEVESLTSSTDLGRVAYLIYNSTEYVVKRHATFSEWMRVFFKIVDVRCPKDVRENKYKPNATFKNRFYFLPYNDQAHDDQTQG